MKMWMLTLAVVCVSGAAFAEARKTCYQLSADGVNWSKTAELLCVQEVGDKARLTLSTLSVVKEDVHATFTLDLLQRARCIDCNVDLYGIGLPSNSVFNNLAIQFDGKRDMRTGKESGTVAIGKTVFHYHSVSR